MLAPTICAAQTSQQFLVLPEFRYLHQQPDTTGNTDEDYRVSLDLLYGLDVGQYRFFAEFTATDDKQELARLHAGYETRGGTTFWLGRFDINHGYWNKTFHFRNYIQPSIQPPGIAGFEEEGGLLPAHFAGIDTRHRWALPDNSTLQLEAGVGAGAKFNGKRLEAYDLLDPDGGHKPSASLRLSYMPDAGSDTEVGIFFVHNRIPMAHALLSKNKQRVLGSYANVRFDALRLYGALYRVDNDLKTISGRRQDSFYTTWLQGDYHVNANWMPYVRIEHSNGRHSDPYVALFPRFIRNRQLAGLRWDFLDNQAIKAEYARSDFLHEESNQWALQWSMIFP